ncbi:MAG: M48 family metallopeptidase, partial [Clostridia bacterium]|nr:M48 family metallopeptidase [Clostridia bacterium]
LLADRKKFDPYYVAKKAISENLSVFELSQEVFTRYPVAEELFGNWENYATKVSFAYIYNGKQPVYGAYVEELPDEQIPFSREPYYDLNELVQEVILEMFHGSFSGISSYSWTDKAYKQYFGCFSPADCSIKINCVLNSVDVPKEVVKFVIYHEMLHRDIKGHNKEFKELEHKYKDYEKHEHFLHGIMNKFEIVEW